ncbi:hypothetical protein KBTX_00048 [wastewater metagenome]|uniref:GGDEF domain-containing protein n=2 Tax=unclassified sequences TaxID=12908 RepID=A0A5B8R730_9ZZZZ|nr:MULTISPECIES: GGDEF domain-containing protein [Arhodomonas]MCS4502769.1 GGDEF domain-containing protein [Arhodomonas aquaeolei]QEA03748.1 hypothetical protein KBTEX_00048 [uncultured organism]
MVAKRQAEPDVWVIEETGADELLSLGTEAVAWLLTLQRATTVDERLGVLTDWLAAQAGVSALRFIDQAGQVRADAGPEMAACSWWRIAGAEAAGVFQIGDDGAVDVNKLSLVLGAVAPLLRGALAYECAVRRARRDPLTGLQNRTAMAEALAAEMDLVVRHEAPLTLLVIDVDHFKTINDCFGHRAGDAVLRQIGERLKAHSRTGDLLFRYAGDEFVVALRQTDEAGAEQAARRLRHLIERAVIQHEDHIIRVSVSVGAACAAAGDTAEALFERADQAMYRDKADATRIRLAAGPARAAEPPSYGIHGQ